MIEKMELKMANGITKPYDFDSGMLSYGSIPINKTKDCVKCEYCAPNTLDNKILILQPRDIGACFKNFPSKVSVIVPNFKKEISCRKLGK